MSEGEVPQHPLLLLEMDQMVPQHLKSISKLMVFQDTQKQVLVTNPKEQ